MTTSSGARIPGLSRFTLLLVKVLLFAEAVIFLCLVQVGLSVSHLRTVRRLLSAVRPILWNTRRLTANQVLRIVNAAFRRLPFPSTCLGRALVAQTLLSTCGFEAHLCIGVKRDEQGQFQAHAWLQKDQQIIFGGSEQEVRRFVPIAGIEEQTA